MFDPKLAIFRAPPRVETLDYHGSLGQLIYDSLRKHPKDLKKYINGETGEITTIGDLLQNATKLVAGFQAINLKDSAAVSLVGGYGRNQFSALLGSIFYGASFFPIDSNLKSLEIQHLLSTAPPDVLFVEKHAFQTTIEAVENLKINPLIMIINSDEKIQGYKTFTEFIKEYDDISEDEFKPREDFDATKQIAIILASSGSTGKPKGVAWTHSNIILGLLVYQQSMGNMPDFSYLSITQLFWASGLLTSLNYLVNSGTYFFVRNMMPDVILNVIQRYRPDATMFVPWMIDLILAHPDFHKYDKTSLKLIIFGGASLPMTLIETMKEKWTNFKDILYTQIYAASEICGVITQWMMGNERSPIDSVGFLAKGMEAKIVDNETGKTLQPNEIGEILLRSPGCHTFYVNNAEANAVSHDSDGFYKTGDLGYITENGILYVTGRIKELIKYKGYQISPPEIEDLILKIKGVKDVAVVGKPQGGEYLTCAAVVKLPEATVTEEDIIKYVEDRLSEPKHLRGGVIFVPSLPYNNNGKKMRFHVLKMLGM